VPDLHFDVRGLENLARLAEEASRAASPDPLRDELADAYLAALKRYVPVSTAHLGNHRVPGELLHSLQLQRTAGGFLASAAAPYAAWVVKGVKAGYMTSLLGKTVSFYAKDGERVTRRVTFVGMGSDGKRHWYHPGTPARNFFREAWEDAAVQVVVRIAEARGLHIGIAFLGAAGER